MLYFNLFRNDLKLNDIHKKCINNIGVLLKESKLDNIHQEFYLFCYLLWNGYFSVDKTFTYSKEVIDENNQVFLGAACCRHIAQLLTEVLKNNKMYAFNLPIHLDKYQSSIFEIDRKIETSNNNITSKNRPNHLVTIVKIDSDNVFLLDATNPCECEIIKKAKILPLTGKYEVNKKLLDSELNFYLYNYYPLKNKCTKTKEEIVFDYKIAKEFCKKNKKLLDDFYDENQYNYETIKKLVLLKN